MIKDVSRRRHHSNGTFHFSSNCWNLEKQICHYISEPRGVCVCNNSVPLVFLCSISIKKIELSHPAKRELIICCEILKEEDTQSMTHFLYDYGMSNFFSKTTLLTLPFTEKGHHDTGWAIDLVPGAPVQSEKNPILTIKY